MTSQRDLSIPSAQRILPLMLLLFVGSGCAALIYEVVWFQLLSFIVGSSAVSLAILLGTFMGGMCLGSLFLSRFVSARRHPLLVYAVLELGIALCGILVFYGLPFAGRAYLAIGSSGTGDLFLRGALCVACLLPPTLLMGATLPAIARWVETTQRGVSWLGFFYGGNIAGAVVGCLLAGFYLLRVYDMAVATYVAMALNVGVAILGILFARITPYTPHERMETGSRIPPGTWPVYVTIALSGMAALGAEVVWTRLLSLLLGATTYTFSLILAAFLIGLGLGSSVGSLLARSLSNPRRALGWCQILVMFCIAWGAYSTSQLLPYWPIDPLLPVDPVYMFHVDILRAIWVVAPAACMWGASFPLALAAVASNNGDAGRLVGSVYAANTVGAIIGAGLMSLFIIPNFGTQNAQRFLIVLSALAALLVIFFVYSAEQRRLQPSSRRTIWGLCVPLPWVAVFLAIGVQAVPGLMVAFGRFTARRMNNHGEVVFVGEGMNSSMAVCRWKDGSLSYHNAGKIQASSEPEDMRLQRMLGHITTLVPKSPRSVLVIGCGAGVTAGAVSINPEVERVTIAEIEKLVPLVVSSHFKAHNYDVVRNPKVTVKIDDARHFLQTTDQKFDAITSDPFDPWVKGAATLYTREFFEMAKRRLNPGGIITVFVQLYESGMPAVKSEVATFMQVFPEGVVWGNLHNNEGYDVVLMGQLDPSPINIDEMEQKLARPEFAQVAQSLREIGCNSATDLFATYGGHGKGLQPWLHDAEVNTDRNLRLQYLAGLGLNAYEQAKIYSEILSYRQWPEWLFTGTPERLEALRKRMLEAK